MKVILRSHQSPGDILMLTAAVRDLKAAKPDWHIGVDTSAPELWENNPHIEKLCACGASTKVLECHYPLIHKSNTAPYHFIHGYRMFLEDKLGIRIPAGDFKGDIHLSDKEKGWMSQVEEFGSKANFWILVAGGKYDFTCKWWNPDYYQEVVNALKSKILFVQVGEKGHWHPDINGVVDLRGKTDLRQLVRLVYHADGVLCPVTLAMHLAAAVPTKPGKPKNRACVVIAGGREPAQWEAYPHHRFLAMNGALSCCDNGGCWKSRCTKVKDGDEKNKLNTCLFPVSVRTGVEYDRSRIDGELLVPMCMEMIKPLDVMRAIENFLIAL